MFNKDKVKNKSILLFSGGLDSLIISKLLKPDILLYINYKGCYQEVEMRRLKVLVRDKIIREERLIIEEEILNLSRYERKDLIIPLRNLFLINIASFFGENIYIGALYGDRSFDKSLQFFKQAKEMLSYLYQEQHWCHGRSINIQAPFKDRTKTELVKMYLERGFKGEDLLLSYSCYKGREKPCGVCKPCFRKWVALTNNYINTRNYFENNPLTAEWLDKEFFEKVESYNYRGEKEDREIISAINLSN